MTAMITFLRPCAVAVTVALAAACASEPAATPTTEAHKEPGSDPITTLPNNYKLEFENDYVRIVRVHYDAESTLPEHTHPAGSTVYVYLNDNEKVIFDHHLGGERPLVRPPVKAGGVRFATSHEEHHTMENPSATPSDFLRIVLKTDKVDLGNAVRRRISLSEQEYSNAQVRVTRLQHTAGETLAVPPSDSPSLMVAWPSGAHKFVDAKSAVSMATDSGTPSGLVRVEFLTAPVK